MTEVTPGDDGPVSDDWIAERREDILQVAAEVFYELGYQGAGMDEIAEQVGLGVDEIAVHFESKASLLVEAAGREAQDFMGTVLRSLTDGSSSAAVLTRLLVELQSGPALPMHQLLAETLATAIRDEEVRRYLDPHVRYASAALAVVIGQAQADRLIAPDVDVDATVHACLTLMFGSCLAKALGIDQPEPEQASSVLFMFIDGLADSPARTIDLREATVGASASDAAATREADRPLPRGR